MENSNVRAKTGFADDGGKATKKIIRLIDDGTYYIELTNKFVPEQIGAILHMRRSDGEQDAYIGDIVCNPFGQWIVRLSPDFETVGSDVLVSFAKHLDLSSPQYDMTVALVDLWKIRARFTSA